MRVFSLFFLAQASVVWTSPQHESSGSVLKLGDPRLHKFVCSEGSPCEPNPGRQMTWYTIQVRDHIRSLQGHTVTSVTGGDMVVIGGLVDGRCSSDVILLNSDVNTWQKLEMSGEFSPRHNHISVSSAGSRTVLLFGGQCLSQHFNDVHLVDLDSRSVSRLETSGTPPPLSEGSRGVLVGKYLVVFGGCGYVPQRTCLNAAYTLHLDTLVWVERSVGGDVPEGRDGHAMFAHGTDVYVWGGRAEEGQVLGDMSALDTQGGQWLWRRIAPSGQAPPPAEFAGVAVVDKTAFLFGGCHNPADPALAPPPPPPPAAVHSPPLSAKTSAAQTPTPLPVSAATVGASRPIDHDDDIVGPLAGVAFLEVSRADPMRPGPNVRIRLPNHSDECSGDLYRFDIDTLEWSVPLVTGTHPSPRQDHGMAVAGGKLFVVGGCQGHQCVGDVYMLDTELRCIDDCHQHGHCVQGICHCHTRFSGVSCDLDFRCPHNCTYRGFCRNASCQCDEGFAGPDCSRDIRCAANCSNHGVCVNAECVCDKPYHGASCNATTNCASDCCGHGFCSSGFCYCDVGYEGDDCCSLSPLLGAVGDSAPISEPADNPAPNANGTETVFVYIGSNKLCGGTPISELRNGSLAHCQNVCVMPQPGLAEPPCSHIAWYPARAMCRLFAVCDEMWSSPGVQMFQRDPLPERVTSPTSIPAPAAAPAAPLDTVKGAVPVGPSRSAAPHQYGVFVYLGIGMVLGTVLGLVAKSLLFSRRSDDEFF